MLNFTVGPVMMDDAVRSIGSEQVPYFRTAEFSALMLENEQLMLRFAGAPEGSRAVFITGSGTASMEASIMGTLTSADRAIVVNGGSFGHRFVELLALHGIPYSEIQLSPGQALQEEMLAPYDGQGYTAFVVNVHETSTGVLYDLDMIGRFCKRNGLFLITDAISSFLVDPYDMSAIGADVMITGSQKALACPPGVSIIVLSPRALARVEAGTPKTMYLDLKDALKNGERGQTPFTPAVGTLRQIHRRLKQIEANGGPKTETDRVAALAADFREKLDGFPFQLLAQHPSNGVTALYCPSGCATVVFLTLKDEYGIWICPNGGAMKDTVFRVGHIGALTTKDNDTLIAALHDLQRRGLL